jgi:hypothetical protein
MRSTVVAALRHIAIKPENMAALEAFDLNYHDHIM